MFGIGITHEYDTLIANPEAETIHANVRHVVTVSGKAIKEGWKTFEFPMKAAGINPASSLVNAILPKAKAYIESLAVH